MPAATGDALALARLRAAFVHTWQLPCPNALKQILWILAVDGVPGSQNPAWFCPLCQPQTDTLSTHAPRLHCFWQCSVATAVRHEIDNGLAVSCPVHTTVSRRALWLLEAPPTSPPLHENFGQWCAWQLWRRWGTAAGLFGGHTATVSCQHPTPLPTSSVQQRHASGRIWLTLQQPSRPSHLLGWMPLTNPSSLSNVVASFSCTPTSQALQAAGPSPLTACSNVLLALRAALSPVSTQDEVWADLVWMRA